MRHCHARRTLKEKINFFQELSEKSSTDAWVPFSAYILSINICRWTIFHSSARENLSKNIEFISINFRSLSIFQLIFFLLNLS